MKRQSIIRVAILCGATGIAAGVVAAASRADQHVPPSGGNSIVCKAKSACLSAQNNGRGGAIVGTITQNHNGNSCGSPTGFCKINGGVTGVDTSTNLQDTNAGVYGASSNGGGVTGVTTFDSSVNHFGQSGVFGIDNSKTRDTYNQNSGVFGWSTHNTGVYGFSIDKKNAVGVWGETPNDGVGVLGSSNRAGVLGYSGDTGSGIGVAAYGHTPMATAFVAYAGTGALMRAFSGTSPSQTQVMLLDAAGNLTVSGTLTQGGSALSVNATSTGRKVLAYTPQQSVRTMEDVGEAQLVGGRAVVPLDPSFASAIDLHRPYLVFITPQGDTSAPLYVTQKTASGFVVREHSGSSSITFDYRIVAQPYGTRTQRLPSYDVPAAHATMEEWNLLQRVITMSRAPHRTP